MSLKKIAFILLLIALISGTISFNEFLVGSGTLLLFQILVPILLIIFVLMLIRKIFLRR